MDILELMKARHSVRKYIIKPIETEKRAELNRAADEINIKSGLHIQILYDEPKCFDSIKARYGRFSDVSNYIALIGKKGADLEETCGYYGEKLVLLAQQLGLNTCWVALTHGKSAATILEGEKQVCLIALGYGKTQGASRKSKLMSELSTTDGYCPVWFSVGMEAAMLAPTAINQQKFKFALVKGGVSAKVSGTGLYTKMDLGIVKYHFEAATGKKVL